MIDKIDDEENSVDYPSEWIYKVIGSDKESVHYAVAVTTIISCRTPGGTQQLVPNLFSLKVLIIRSRFLNYFTGINSALLFKARPSFVSLPAIGLDNPNPTEVIRDCSTPFSTR